MAGMAVAFIVLLAGAIYSLSQFEATSSTASLQVPDIQSTLRKDLPHFEYVTPEKTLTHATIQGKWTLLTFWAHWCQPCLDELPGLNQLAASWQGPEFNIITVNVDDPESENYALAAEFLQNNDLILPTVFDKSGELKKTFEVVELPRHFLISPKGEIRWDGLGAFSWNDSRTRDLLLKAMETERVPAPESEPESAE